MNELTQDEHKILVDAIHDSATVIHKGQIMNKRIQELAQQARKNSVRWGVYSEEEFYEKFAKLIVRECVNVCESMQLIGPYKEVQNATLKDAAIEIKEHFGVEE